MYFFHIIFYSMSKIPLTLLDFLIIIYIYNVSHHVKILLTINKLEQQFTPLAMTAVQHKRRDSISARLAVQQCGDLL